MDAPSKPANRIFVRVDLVGPSGTPLRTSAVLGMVGVGMQGVLRFATTLLVSYLAGKAVLGAVSPAIATAMFLSLLWPLSAGQTASKYVAQARGGQRWDEARAVAWFLSGRTIIASVVLAGIGWAWLAWHGHDPHTGAWVAVLVLGYSGYSFVRGLQFGAGLVVRATGWDVLTVVLALVGLVICLLAGVRSTALMLPVAGGYLLYAVTGLPRVTRIPLAPGLRRELNHFTWLGVVTTVASSGFLQLNLVVAKEVDVPARVGDLTAALALATPASMLASSLSLVLFPAMAQAWASGDVQGFRRQGDRIMRVLVLLLVAVFGALLLGHRLLLHVMSARYVGARPLLVVLLYALLAIAVAVPAGNSLATRSRRGLAVVTGANLAGLAVGCGYWWVQGPGGGVMAIAVGYLCGAALLAVVPIAAVWLLDRHRWGGLLLRVALAVLALQLLLHVQDRHNEWWVQLLMAAGFCLGWVAISWRDVRSTALPLLRRD